MMNQVLRWFAVSAGVVVLAVGSVQACEQAGKNVHVGTITQVNAEEGTFTIHDVAQQRPITFSADAQVLDAIAGVTRQVMVHYQENGDELLALSVR